MQRAEFPVFSVTKLDDRILTKYILCRKRHGDPRGLKSRLKFMQDANKVKEKAIGFC